MKELILDAATWKTKDDVYNSFFKVVGAPEWHGRNFDALNDSISAGGINTVEVPYRLVIQHHDSIAPGAKQMADNFVDLVREIAGRGCPVEIVVGR
jgi:RNAse (barnase) inhibitor barstar